MQAIGISGRIAKAFISSRLTPLIVIASILMGIGATIITPREEEPQIVVPMVDVMVGYPGASSEEVEQMVTRPLESLLWEIDGVEYVYSIAQPDQNLTIVRFYVGQDMEDSLVKLYNKLMSNMDRIPVGVTQPLVKPRSIDDVPVLALTLHSDRYGGYELRRVAEELKTALRQDSDVSEVTVTGGQRRQMRIVLDPSRMHSYNVSPLMIAGALQASNIQLPSGSFQSMNREYRLETGGFLRGRRDVGDIVAGVWNGSPVYIRDIAEIIDGPGEPSEYVFIGFGPGASRAKHSGTGIYEAVTLAIAKKKGTNASLLADRLLEKVEALKGEVIPSEVSLTVTRNYGETAKEKSDELLKHMLIATVSVIILIALTLGWREAIVVAVAVPVTLALTLLINYLFGYTLNRVTLFALIFSIGILVDDAIVVVENIHRHFTMHKPTKLTAVLAVDEVGNPTILATFAVIAALLPMAFVSGLMGPYMKPIPVGASAAMLFSLFVAFIVSPWLGYKVLRNVRHANEEGSREAKAQASLYERIISPILAKRRMRLTALLVVIGLLAAAVMLVPLKAVAVKMLPFDNKSEFQVIIDMPEDSTLENTASLTREIAEYIREVPEVSDFQMYAGTSAPYNFNGLVRHYFLRSGPAVADIQVNLLPKHERSAQSHDIAKRVRPGIQKIAARYNANVKITEIPPGPPVLSTLVAEVYGPDLKRQREIASEVKKIFASTEGVVDVDWFVEDDYAKYVFDVDKAKAAESGISTENISQTLRVALSGMPAGLVHVDTEKEPLEIVLRMPLQERSSIQSLREVKVQSPSGSMVPASELVTLRESPAEKTIYHKNLKRVTYVTADVAGSEESPVYAILKMKDRISGIKLGEGYELKQYSSVQPGTETRYAMKWDGEWHISYEVFRDLGIAFAAVLVIIYILVVGWFRNFLTPIVIMSPIPLTLVGILPGHAALGAFFTATSMIGFIALSGIIVRNSILLVDFINQRVEEGEPLERAIVEAGTVRFRPIVLTATAVVVGSFIMLFDPIFEGLAISMMFGAVAATALTLVAVPLLYYELAPYIMGPDACERDDESTQEAD